MMRRRKKRKRKRRKRIGTVGIDSKILPRTKTRREMMKTSWMPVPARKR